MPTSHFVFYPCVGLYISALANGVFINKFKHSDIEDELKSFKHVYNVRDSLGDYKTFHMLNIISILRNDQPWHTSSCKFGLI